MKMQVRSEGGCYYVDAYFDGYWRPLANFSDWQGDAIFFAFSVCLKLSDAEILKMARYFDPNKISKLGEFTKR